jgi:SAM-dependent methyltransferase
VKHSKEMFRLESKFGWTSPLPNSDGVRMPNNSNHSPISFPEDSWDDKAVNDEGVGVWGEIRLREVHSLMLKHGLSTIWEVGAGNGAVCLGLSALGHEVIAVEPLYGGAKYIAEKGLTSFGSTLNELKLPSNSIPSIGVFDVLEHIEQTGPMLHEFARVLRKDGLLLISVPAHEFLFSKHDSSIGHFRRYSKSKLRHSLDSAGFELVSCTFLFSFLVPVAWLLRVLPEKLGLGQKADSISKGRTQLRIANALSPVFRLGVAVEKLFRFPFGLSLFAVARPKNNSLP